MRARSEPKRTHEGRARWSTLEPHRGKSGPQCLSWGSPRRRLEQGEMCISLLSSLGRKMYEDAEIQEILFLIPWEKVCIHYPGTWAYMDTDRREWTNTHMFVCVCLYTCVCMWNLPINSHLKDNTIHGTFKRHRKSFVSMALLIIHRNWTHFFSYNPK